MGLVSKEVEVNINGSNYKHYENLGYEIPLGLATKYTYEKYKKKYVLKKGTKIKVKVKDLLNGSHVKVQCECDYCHKIYPVVYNDYLKHNHDGKTYCNRCSNKVFNSGENAYNWRSDLTQEERENARVRNYNPKYTEFVKKVMARDNYTCQVCGQYQGDIEAHHLNGYNWDKEHRYDETNGITLCHKCHYNYHSICGKGNNTKEQFEKWYGKAVELVKYSGELSTARKIYCIEEDKVYNSAKELAKEWNYDHSTIYDVCNHKMKKYKDRKGIQKTRECKTVKGKHVIWLSEAIEKGYVKEPIHI